MNITTRIENRIKKFKAGEIFTYKDLEITPQEYVAASKALERLVKKRVIRRISTGVFYKPKRTSFGDLIPNEEKIITPYLFKNGRRIAYITGTLLYNKMGLTTQIPAEISIASRSKRIYISKGNIKAKAVKSYVEVTNKNYKLLQILDALKDFNIIPDLDKKSAIIILINKLNELNSSQITQLVKYAFSYPPRVRALLGALLENTDIKINLEELKQSLNPLSKYKFGITKELLPNIDNWNIK